MVVDAAAAPATSAFTDDDSDDADDLRPPLADWSASASLLQVTVDAA